MAVTPELRAAMQKIDTATNGIGAVVTRVSGGIDGVSIRFDALKAQISTRMTDAEVAEVHGVIDAGTTRIDAAVVNLDAAATVLNGIGAVPDNPVPVPIPEPPPVEPPIV